MNPTERQSQQILRATALAHDIEKIVGADWPQERFEEVVDAIVAEYEGGDMECNCFENSWYGPEHASACPFAGQPRKEAEGE